MKILLIAAVVLSQCIACGGNDSKKPDSKESNSGTVDITKDPDYAKGLELIAKNKCLTCHDVDNAVTGPPYREVANRYASYPDTIVGHLARKIISGGNGQWGEIFMTPHAGLSQADAEAMVRYILLLKK